jgi:hypothetical protein
MKLRTTPLLCTVIAGLTAAVIWQGVVIHRLREAVEDGAVEKKAAHLAQTSSVRKTDPASSVPSPAPDTTGTRPRIAVRNRKELPGVPAEAPPRIALEPPPPETPDAGPPPALTPERRKALLEGGESFNPGPIEESTLPVTDKTVLTKGQALQINYSNTWYAGEVIGFESDGGVHVRYFGWSNSWDEVVPRSDLRLDPQAREHAVDKYGARSVAVVDF